MTFNMFRTIDRYVMAELFRPFFLAVLGLIIVILSMSLSTFTDLIFSAGAPTGPVLLLLFYSLPAVVVLAFPVAYLFSSLLGIGRMTRDFEITALRSSGVSSRRILMPILLGALLISVVNFFFNDSVVPWSNLQIKTIKEQLMKDSLRPIIRPNVFFQGTTNRSFYVKAFDSKTGVAHDIFILDQSLPGLPQVITARTGRWVSVPGSGIWVLQHGTLHKYGQSGYVDHEIHFKTLDIQFSMQNPYLGGNLDPASMTAQQVDKQIQGIKKSGGNAHALEVALWQKYSIPLATFAAALMAAPLGMLFSRLGPYIGVALSVILVFLYYTAMQTFAALGQSGYLPPFLAAWLQNIIFGAIGFWLLSRVDRR